MEQIKQPSDFENFTEYAKYRIARIKQMKKEKEESQFDALTNQLETAEGSQHGAV